MRMTICPGVNYIEECALKCEFVYARENSVMAWRTRETVAHYFAAAVSPS